MCLCANWVSDDTAVTILLMFHVQEETNCFISSQVFVVRNCNQVVCCIPSSQEQQQDQRAKTCIEECKETLQHTTSLLLAVTTRWISHRNVGQCPRHVIGWHTAGQTSCIVEKHMVAQTQATCSTSGRDARQPMHSGLRGIAKV